MRRLGICGVAFLCAVWQAACFAQSAPPERPGSTDGRPQVGSSQASLDAAIGHLLKAADFFEAAGLDDDAQRLRQEARGRVGQADLLARKVERLQSLQDEIAALRAVMDQPVRIAMRVVPLQFSRSALGDQGCELDRLLGVEEQIITLGGLRNDDDVVPATPDQELEYRVSPRNPRMHPVLVRLIEQHLVRVLAEPVVVTQAGQWARWQSGSPPTQLQRTQQGQPTGAEEQSVIAVEMHPRVQPNGGLHLKVKVVWPPSGEFRSAQGNGEDQSARKETRMSLQARLRSGETLIIGRGPALPLQPIAQGSGPDAAAGDLETVLLITPELVGPDASHSSRFAPSPATAGDDEALLRYLREVFVPDDLQYFPATPVPRRGTLR
ncbi:MAG: hypothetical protein ACKV0T_08635 [Planctomycetales bacterium]